MLIRLIYLLMVRLFCWPAVPAAVPRQRRHPAVDRVRPVTLYGRDPDRRPDINGKVGASAPGAVSRLPAVLDQIDLIDLEPRIRILVRAAEPATVRSLDAIHLGTALQSRPGLTWFVTYDKRLLGAAQTAGLRVDSPGGLRPNG